MTLFWNDFFRKEACNGYILTYSCTIFGLRSSSLSWLSHRYIISTSPRRIRFWERLLNLQNKNNSICSVSRWIMTTCSARNTAFIAARLTWRRTNVLEPEEGVECLASDDRFTRVLFLPENIKFIIKKSDIMSYYIK